MMLDPPSHDYGLYFPSPHQLLVQFLNMSSNIPIQKEMDNNTPS